MRNSNNHRASTMKTKIIVGIVTILGLVWIMPARAQSDINLTGYTQTFDDEFNSLSATTTSPKGSANWYALPPNGAPGYFSASNWNISALSVSSGILTNEAYWNGSSWQSGFLASVDTTKAGFSQLYGYFEIRCEMPNAGEGAWPSFWLDSTNGITAGSNEELDVFEWYGVCNTPGADYDYVQEASHNWNSDGTQNTSLPYLYSPTTNMPSGAYPWQGYHIYGVQVDPIHITWYVDGVQTNQIATPTTYLTSPFYLILDYGLGGGWNLTGSPFTTDGTSSLLVDWVRVYSLPSGGSAPAVPTGLSATGGNGQVSLAWTASSGASSYNVYRGTTAGGELSTAIASGITSTSYVDPGLTNGNTYYYKVTAVNSYGTSGYSNEASATPTSGGGSGTTTYYQDSFSRSGDMTGSTPDVTNTGGATWGNTAGTGQYPISGGTASIAPSAYSWSAEYLPVNGSSGITLDGTKNFTRSAVVTPSAVASARTGISLNTAVPGNLFSNYFAAMSTCSGFAGAYAFNGGSINYNYAAGISGATTISISYSASAATVTYQVGSTTLYTQTGVTAAQVAAIRYIALGDDGYGGGDATPAPTFDNFTFTVGSGSGGSAPPAAANLAATAGNGQVSLSWSSSSGATSYNVYRGTSSGGETGIATGVTSPSYVDTGLTNGTTYYYKVTAVNSYGASGYSNEASATPTTGGSAPPAPTGLTATAGNAQVSLSWTASTGATSYSIYRGTSSGGEGGTAIATGITVASYTNTGLTNGTPYYYKVTAVNTYGASGYSNEASATPQGSGGTTTTYYQDSFSRTGDVTGSMPDVVDTGGATWSNTNGSGEYPVSSGVASIASSAYSWTAEYLPVNGGTGITLDGTKNFTISVVVTAGSSGLTGISLNTAAPGELFDSDFAVLATCSGFAGAYAFNGGNIDYNYSSGISGPTTISIAYSASAATLTYTVGDTIVATQTGVTTAQVSAVRYIALGDDGYGGGDAAPEPTFDNFTFTVGTSGGGSAPPAPGSLGATVGNGQISLNWSASSGATSYNVYSGTSAGGESSTPIVTGLTSTSYTNTGLTNGTAYYYKVAAVNSYGTSGYSNETTATPSSSAGAIYYQDGFSRTGELNGSAPDAHDTNSNTWTVGNGSGVYSTNGTVAYDHDAAYDAAYLPVNGSSGITMDGTKNFTLSAIITPDSSGQWMGISLNTGSPGTGNIFTNGLVEIIAGNGYAGAFNGGTNLTYSYGTPGTGSPAKCSLTYNASAHAVTYMVGTTTVYTLTGVTAAQIASLRDVSLGNGEATSSATIDCFTLTIGP
jgi:fibronectin type 3 domain-containing protein